MRSGVAELGILVGVFSIALAISGGREGLAEAATLEFDAGTARTKLIATRLRGDADGLWPG